MTIRQSRFFTRSLLLPLLGCEVSKSYSDDSFMQQLIIEVIVSLQNKPNFHLSNWILRYKWRLVICNNEGLRHELLYQCHNSGIGGHSGVRATYEWVKQHCYWPNMKKHIIQWGPTVGHLPTSQCWKSSHLETLTTIIHTITSMDSYINGFHQTTGQIRE